MTSKKNKARSARETNRKFKKKANPIKVEKVEYIDYKDVNLLQKFMTDRSKIRGQKLAGVSVQEQRDIANAIKNAREMALLPYTKRTVSTRAPRAGSDRREEEGNLELEAADRDSARTVAEALSAKPLTIKAKAGNEGRLFGSVTTADISAALTKQAGVTLDRKKIVAQPIRTLGSHSAVVRLHADVEVAIKINVVA